MKLTIESTTLLTKIDGVPVRLWRGRTEEGLRCEVYVHLIAANEQDAAEFDRELSERLPPGEYVRFLETLAPPPAKR